MRDIITPYKSVAISIITYIETAGFKFEDESEKTLIEGFLQQFNVIPTEMPIANKAAGYKQIRRIKTPDAIILATASYLDADLITVNESDFKGLDPAVRIIVPMLLP